MRRSAIATRNTHTHVGVAFKPPVPVLGSMRAPLYVVSLLKARREACKEHHHPWPTCRKNNETSVPFRSNLIKMQQTLFTHFIYYTLYFILRHEKHILCISVAQLKFNCKRILKRMHCLNSTV